LFCPFIHNLWAFQSDVIGILPNIECHRYSS
jgi:hypothetical protein